MEIFSRNLPPEEYDLSASPVPAVWRQGMYAGNGNLGCMVYADPEHELLVMEIGCAEIIDCRPEKFRIGGTLFDSPRLEIGKYCWKAPGIAKNSSIRLSLQNAEITGQAGDVPFRILVSEKPSAVVVETALEQETFHPVQAISPRIRCIGKIPENYVFPPDPVPDENGCTQLLLNGRSFRTAWKADENFFFIACAYDDNAERSLAECSASAVEAMREKVRSSFREFYRTSSLSVPDTDLEKFYWINLYKWHSASRPENPFVLDLMGPWSKSTWWPAIWWNLNLQLTYQWLLTAGRYRDFLPLTHTVTRCLAQFQKNAEPVVKGGAAIGRSSSYDCRSHFGEEKGNLPWVCHLLEEAYRYSGDAELLKVLPPLLKGVLKCYGTLLQKKEDGKYHLQPTLSPEYGTTADCNYDLALLRRCIMLFLQYCKDDPEYDTWKQILAELTDYPQDAETGYRIGADLALTESHRHYSHLFMIYPLELSHDPETAKKSIAHWFSMPEALAGYSYTGAAAMEARNHHGNEAAEFLHGLLKWQKDHGITNGMYLEGDNPVIETPFAFNASLQDMLLWSSADTIRLFPAVPDDWQTASFRNFAADGNLQISGTYSRREQRIFCRIRSEVNRKVRIILPGEAVSEEELCAGEIHEFNFKLPCPN